MFSTGMMDPDWWKYNALNHRWYRDDDAYADYCEGGPIMDKYVGIHFDGAQGYSSILISHTSGSVSFTPTDDPFELKINGTNKEHRFKVGYAEIVSINS